jgi:diguanylate cyclase
MTTLTNPFEIARETLRLLATRRIPPSPDNYLTLYHEIAGTKPASNSFPEEQLRSLAAALPKASPDQLRLARQLDEAVKSANWADYKKYLTEFIAALAESQKLGWSELIADLLRQWEAKHPGLTTTRKRESLEHILTSSGANPGHIVQSPAEPDAILGPREGRRGGQHTQPRRTGRFRKSPNFRVDRGKHRFAAGAPRTLRLHA